MRAARLRFLITKKMSPVANRSDIAAMMFCTISIPISDQIKLLEEYFNCLLFERKNRGLLLTKEGDIAVQYAENIFGLAIELTSRLRHNIKIPKKTIDIGISHSMTQYFLYENILPLFEQDELSVNIKEQQRHLLLAHLEEGHLDLVFTDDKSAISSTMNSYRVGINRTFVVAHKKLKKKGQEFPQSLNNIPFFNYTNDSTLRYEIELYFSRNTISPKVIGEADDVDLLKLVTQQAIAFTIVPEVAKNQMIKDKNIVVLGELEELQTSIWGIVRKDYKGLGLELLRSTLKARS